MEEIKIGEPILVRSKKDSFDVWEEPAAAKLSTFRKDEYCISFCMQSALY